MKSLQELESNLTILIDRYQQICEENRLLTEDNRRQHNELMEAHAQIVQLQHAYRDLQTATSMLGDESQREKARLYLNQIINQVDLAIDVLKS